MQIKTVPIKACARVLPGFSIKTSISHDPNGTHQIILARHLPEIGPYEYKEEHVLKITPERPPEKYCVSAGDILFMSRGSLNRAILLNSVPENTLATASFYIIKPGAMIAPGYLAYCLNQEPFQNKIAEIRTGAGTPLVPRADFSQIPIILPSLEEQNKIAEIGNLMIHEKILINRMLEKLELKHRLLGKKILNKLEYSSLKNE
ncbi:MAG TPA: restriction endonuclease subunit S [Desulfobacteraceae bacterium]|nr:restriction endonuclease subunit S [Desulfobacteraceae bacterium]HPJ68208.1 restriction endonuclease subunit S [Desulfobacteraceae bacterium]HPQ28864.1 restriction endonuclease subunit S [Desulfobacteraceae bacterium]